MVKYAWILDQVREAFSELIIQHIPRAENTRADQLGKMASTLTRTTDSDLLEKELVSQVKLPECNTEEIR